MQLMETYVDEHECKVHVKYDEDLSDIIVYDMDGNERQDIAAIIYNSPYWYATVVEQWLNYIEEQNYYDF